MKKKLFTIFAAAACMLTAGCSSSETKDGQDPEQTEMTEDGLEETELKKVPLPCDKEVLYAAWKRIGVIELARKKSLDYRQHTPLLYLSTDLDQDGNPEVLLRGEPPYAAIYTFVKDSLHLITFADHTDMGYAITPDGVILRNGIGAKGSSITEFIRLEKSQVAQTGAARETFVIEGNTMTSGGTQYMLQADTTMVEVAKDDYLKVAPASEGTYLEDIDGWEDFRKP